MHPMSLRQNQETWLLQLPSPGLVFRLGVLIHQGLDALLCHIGQHGERGLHNEVNETCREGGRAVEVSYLEGRAEDTADMAMTPSRRWNRVET